MKRLFVVELFKVLSIVRQAKETSKLFGRVVVLGRDALGR